MSPRRNRPPRAGRDQRGRGSLDPDELRRGVEAVQSWRASPWRVRQVPGSAAGKLYRCPGCDHEIRPGVPHVVVWPAAGPGGEQERRHWHSGCWRARDRRPPV